MPVQKKPATKPDPFPAALAELQSSVAAADLLPALRSAIRAVLPGRQQKRNLEPQMQLAAAAFARTIRRRARAKAKRSAAPRTQYDGEDGA